MAMMQYPESLKHIPMLANLPRWQLEVVAESVEPLEFEEGSQLLESGTDDGYTYFLSEGELLFDAGDGMSQQISATSDAVRAPVANLRPRLFGVKALSYVRAFRVPDIVLSASGLSYKGDSIIDEEPEEVGEPTDDERNLAEARLSLDLYRELRNDRAVLPSLPDLAFRIRRAIDDELGDARAVAKLVELDPALAANLLKAANSALYGGLGSVKTVSSAVVRLGLRTTRQLVLSLALRDVFRSDDALIRRRMKRLWKHSANVAALCFVLARRVKGLDPEEALLVGLVHDLGVIPILAHARRYPALVENEQTLEETVRRMRGDLGAMILRGWSFAPEVIAGAREAENWERDHDGPADYIDLVIVAQVHERMRKHEMDDLPILSEITALTRVLGEDLSAEKSLEVLHEAKEQIDEMRSVLISSG